MKFLPKKRIGFKRIFALFPHVCEECRTTVWLEHIFRRKIMYWFWNPSFGYSYRCKECHNRFKLLIKDDSGVIIISNFPYDMPPNKLMSIKLTGGN
jgi:hypothetical protein